MQSAVKRDHPNRGDPELTAEAVVDAALAVLEADGLDAVSMRRVAAELGVSPIPVYSRVGNKDALLDAMATRLAAGIDPEPRAGEAWPDYAARWCHALRERRAVFTDSRLLMRGWRESMVEATRPLIRLMRDSGIDTDRAVDAARLLMWSVLGHTAIELGHRHDESVVDVDRLFADHVRYLVDGLRRELAP